MHCFDPKIAAKVGVNAATLYQNIVFWAEHNMRNRKHSHDGLWWTYNSRRAFSEQFEYLTENQIKTALTKLVDCGLVVKGCYNVKGFDKTSWYSPTESKDWPVGEKSPMDRSKITNALGENHQPIPDSKPDDKPNTSSEPAGDASDLFDEFWKHYPKKAGKAPARKAWSKAVRKAQPRDIIEATKKYAQWLKQTGPGVFRPMPKNAQGWLNDERWNDTLDGMQQNGSSHRSEIDALNARLGL